MIDVDINKDPGMGLSENQINALRMDNLGVWCAVNNFKVDHKPFTFKRRKFLKKIYLSNNSIISVNVVSIYLISFFLDK